VVTADAALAITITLSPSPRVKAIFAVEAVIVFDVKEEG